MPSAETVFDALREGAARAQATRQEISGGIAAGTSCVRVVAAAAGSAQALAFWCPADHDADLPGSMAEALTEGTSLPSDQPGPGHLVLTDDEIATYRARIAHLTAVSR
ncbi:hypothetical protein [Streptomyces inhibens]|uniref:hypothetical protein n=1 Tax=Streptomyces inhibens TaxID=2293571 RepID=UPI001EE72A5D|nr:hypothetical protein [Streptomyces inhibens]UKY47808.1 hypothetical protein KI385_02485 [Streptomyces inhibens]